MISFTARWIRRHLCAAFMLPALSSSAQTVPEYELKAAFVYNFVLFTDWPADTPFEGGMLTICVRPDSPMRRSLDGLADRVVKGRKIAVRSLAAAANPRACNLVYLDGADGERWMQNRKGQGSGVLTVSDDEEIDRAGAIIVLAMEGSRIVFDIDARAARQAGLTLSSKLLRLARRVR